MGIAEKDYAKHFGDRDDRRAWFQYGTTGLLRIRFKFLGGKWHSLELWGVLFIIVTNSESGMDNDRMEGLQLCVATEGVLEANSR
ncbi:hypothetical protein TNCT_197131 [Trichonephila clavata]|uniref:Uncharacterized protein n=1 Tax=Trichonephila clavata TaxID=2740835 RepID=A0A8X6FAM9_TRICU|nr:hypothetical protein TNCT_197131 [Trichonephila clavata]